MQTFMPLAESLYEGWGRNMQTVTPSAKIPDMRAHADIKANNTRTGIWVQNS